MAWETSYWVWKSICCYTICWKKHQPSLKSITVQRVISFDGREGVICSRVKMLTSIAVGFPRPHCIQMLTVNPVPVVWEMLLGVPACQHIFENVFSTWVACFIWWFWFFCLFVWLFFGFGETGDTPKPSGCYRLLCDPNSRETEAIYHADAHCKGPSILKASWLLKAHTGTVLLKQRGRRSSTGTPHYWR